MRGEPACAKPRLQKPCGGQALRRKQVGGEIHLECKLFPALGSKLKIDIIGREFRMASAIENQLRFIGSRYDIAALYAFGSRAGEVAGKVRSEVISPKASDSDVDIGVQSKSGRYLNAKERVRLAIDLEDLLEVNRVDLVILGEADPFLALEIVRGELIYCADADAQAEYELYVLRRAGDLAFYARERWKQILTGTTP